MVDDNGIQLNKWAKQPKQCVATSYEFRSNGGRASVWTRLIGELNILFSKPTEKKRVNVKKK